MNRLESRRASLLAAALVAVAGCASDTASPEATQPGFTRLGHFSSWSTPVSLGPVVNTPGSDNRGSALSPNGLSLYFASARDGGFGNLDIYVSHRANQAAPWGPAQNLGPVINSDARDNHPFFTADGHWMYYASTRAGGCGGFDIWISHRRDVHDDFGWETPANLGCTINTAADENSATLLKHGNLEQLYFVSNRDFNPNVDVGFGEFYVSTRQRDGSWGPGVHLSELGSPYNDNKLAISKDGLEAYFSSDRPGGPVPGDFNTWVTTRRSLTDQWGTPEIAILHAGLPWLSRDGTTLLLADLMISTRHRIGGTQP